MLSPLVRARRAVLFAWNGLTASTCGIAPIVRSLAVEPILPRTTLLMLFGLRLVATGRNSLRLPGISYCDFGYRRTWIPATNSLPD